MDASSGSEIRLAPDAALAGEVVVSAERAVPYDRVGAPPWLYLWAVLFLVSLPHVFRMAAYAWEVLGQQMAADAALAQAAPEFRLSLLTYPLNFIDVIPALALLLGLGTVLLPGLRRAYLEKRFRLEPLAASLPALEQIAAFVGYHAPQLELRGNPLRMNQLAFVYPAGYRQTRLAVFGGLITLWHRDREAAEAVLLHEIAHARRGDALIVGAGSLLERILKLAVVFYLAFFLLPFLLMTVVQRVSFHLESSALGMPAGIIWAQHGRQLVHLFAAGPGLVTLASLLYLLAGWALVLAAIWTVELNADRLVVAQQQSAAGVSRALAAMVGRVGWWRWLLFRLAHPPLRLRQWMAGQSGRLGLAVLLSLFPLAYAVRLLGLHAWASANYLTAQFPASQIIGTLGPNTKMFLASVAPAWAAMALLLLVWPFVWLHWERLAGRARSAPQAADLPVYLIVGVTIGAGALVGFWLR